MKKSQIVVLLLIVALVLLVLSFFQRIDAPKSNGGLSINPAALYQTDNELYFDNKLPKDVIIVAEEAPDRLPGEEVFALTQHAAHTHWYKMYISPRMNFNGAIERFSIYHEACHIERWEARQAEGLPERVSNEHGSDWQRCMLSLAERGAFADIW